MHAFLLSCVLVESIAIVALWWSNRSLKRGEAFISERLDQIIGAINPERLDDIENRTSDLSAGCDKIDADLSALTEDLKEFRDEYREERREVSKRISEIAEEQEKIRRKASTPGSRYSWIDSRRAAEATAVRADPDRDRLVALAEG